MPKPARQSVAVEDYVKAIYAATANGDPASTAELATRLKVTAASVSSMLKRLDQEGLVAHEPYRGVRLTDDGTRLALHVVRRHRLIELFLSRILDIPWERVHAEAEILEHAVSDELVEAIAAKLGHPDVDPHGDPIPSRELAVSDLSTRQLAALDAGQSGRLVRVDDADPAMLRHLTDVGIALGDQLTVLAREPFDGSITIRTSSVERPLPFRLAEAMHVASS